MCSITGRWSETLYTLNDIVEGVVRICDHIATPDPTWTGASPDPATSASPYRTYNIGNNHPEKLTRLIELLEECLGRKATRNLLPMQPGDVPATAANVDDLERDVG